MKTILIPGDFSDETLNLVDRVLSYNSQGTLHVIVFHAIRLSASVTDLLRLSKRSKEYESIKDEFHDGCRILERRYRFQSLKISIQFFYGHTVSLFRDFLKANKVDLILLDPSIARKGFSRNSLDPIKMIHNSKFPVFEVKDKDDSINLMIYYR